MWSTVILIGVFWGFLECSLGGFLHMLDLPYTGQIMAPIGFALLFLGMKNGFKTRQLLSVAVIAAFFKLLDCFLFGLPLHHLYIINPMQAILMQGIAFAVAVSPFISVPLSVILFNLFSCLIFGADLTPMVQQPAQVVLFHIPATVILTLVLQKVVAGNLFNMARFSPVWRMVSSAVLVILSIVLRSLFV